MNAKLIEAGDADEDGIGLFVFGTGQAIGDGDGVEENRSMLQELFVDTNMLLANTYFCKQPSEHITYTLDKQARTEAPSTKGRFEVIDYIIHSTPTTEEWHHQLIP
jgi:hypothetical protein